MRNFESMDQKYCRDTCMRKMRRQAKSKAENEYVKHHLFLRF